MSEFNKGLDEAGVTIVHHMPDGDGVYIKETFISAGAKLAMHKHVFSHKSVLASGYAKVYALESSAIDMAFAPQIKGPYVMGIKIGVSHCVEALTDCVWLCIHATDERDPDKIDHTLVTQ